MTLTFFTHSCDVIGSQGPEGEAGEQGDDPGAEHHLPTSGSSQ